MATSKPRRSSRTRKTATTLTEIPDHIIAEIFLRLPAAEDLARASAACVSFRRLVADKSFLRRFRRLHDPPLLAFFDRNGFHHPLPPHPSAPAASALADAADLSFSFFPNHGRWSVQDIREGRVLLLRPGACKQPQICMEAAVCDPLHRKYVLLPPVPDDLAASMMHPATAHEPWCEAFLVPLDEEAETAFGVMWMVHFTTRLAAFVYSSTTGQWQAVASKEWNELLLGQGESTMVSPIDRDFYGRYYAYGCFYWESTVMGKKDLLVFDTRRMEFSSCDLPPKELCPLDLAIVEAGEARLGLFGIHLEAGKFDLCYYIKGNKCESSSQWQLEKTIPICSGCRPDIKAATGRYLLLGKFGPMRFVNSTPHQDLEYISVDVKTLQLARVCTKSSGFAFSKTSIYTNFPPSLSSPKI
ncbi:uncharacterized protein LOC119356891 [Triticum dicoccoides]|uniref:uncharacterized protein LOC119356891 n=1 Tax=Triticum dicoccoides TaxID=85692 RepID=UPI00188E4E22|nr:uncharacterized protein LOC119356891 [Triticum dicoccoides]